MTDTPTTAAEMREAAEPWRAVTFRYTNWRGETATRRAVPAEIFWSATEHHPEPQWIMRALDLDKNTARDFALKDCDFRRALPSDDEAETEERVAMAICATHGDDPERMTYITTEPGVIEPYGPAWTRYLPDARAAIAAMRGE